MFMTAPVGRKNTDIINTPITMCTAL